MAQYAVEKHKLDRLVQVLEEETGHDMAFAVEAAKIAANSGTVAAPEVDLSVVSPQLRVPLYPVAMTATLTDMANNIAAAAEHTLNAAGTDPGAVTKVIFVGGTSLMQVVRDALRDLLPKADVHHGAAMTAIVEGLALAAGDGL